MSHNPIRPWRNIERRKSRQVRVGNVLVGGDAPIAVQTMTNTPTEDAEATIAQILRCAEAGADIVRVSCPTEESTRAMRQIVKASPVPLVADIHFHYKRGIEAADAGAACLRINPGNIGSPARVTLPDRVSRRMSPAFSSDEALPDARRISARRRAISSSVWNGLAT